MNKDNYWIICDEISTYIQSVYDMVEKSVVNYDYIKVSVNSKKKSGLVSEQIEYMAVFVTPDNNEKFIQAANTMGVIVQPQVLVNPATKKAGQCYIFNIGSFANMNNKMFKQIVRRAVKDERIQNIMRERANQRQVRGVKERRMIKIAKQKQR